MLLSNPSSQVQSDRIQAKDPVLLVGSFLSSSAGARQVCEDLATRLATSGWPVLTTSHKRGRFARIFDMIRTVWTTRHKYSVANIDVYSGAAFVTAEVVCQILHWIKKPYVISLHGGNLPAFAKRWPTRVRRLLHSADAVTTPSRYLYESMSNFRKDINLLPNSLDLRTYKFRLRQKPRALLVWLRAFHCTYNPALAPKVLSLLQEDFADIRLTMVGPDKRDGSLREMQETATNLGVMNRIRLLGGVEKTEVPGLMEEGDIFLNTTNIDNTPVSVLEAMASGLCIVSTNVGGIPHLLEHEVDALLVPPNNAPAMAVAVSRILTEPGLAGRLSRNAREKAEQFDWSVILPRWEALLISVSVSKSAAVETHL